jgi:hypothetical protein
MLAPTLREKDRETERLQSEAEYIDLYGDMVEAILSVQPERVIPAPGLESGEAKVYDLVADELAGVDQDSMRCGLTRLLGMAAIQSTNVPLQELALKLVLRIAESHAWARSGL